MKTIRRLSVAPLSDFHKMCIRKEEESRVPMTLGHLDISQATPHVVIKHDKRPLGYVVFWKVSYRDTLLSQEMNYTD